MLCDGKVAVVTGASGSGIGRSVALTLAREGARVVVNYRADVAAATAVVDRIRTDGGQAIAAAADIFDAQQCRALWHTAAAHFGQVDICVVGPGAGWHPATIDILSPDDMLQDVQKEVGPVSNLMSLALPGMYERGWGRFIGIASHPDLRSPAYAYNTAKAARTQAILLAQAQAWSHGVTMNVIAPGPVSGLPDLAQAADQAAHGPAWSERTNVSPQDIAEGVAFLCSDAGRFVSGSVIPYLFK